MSILGVNIDTSLNDCYKLSPPPFLNPENTNPKCFTV